jgi:hypothetical protein
MRHHLRAERLAQPDDAAQPLLRRRVGHQRRVLHVLGTYAEDHPAAGVGGERGPGLERFGADLDPVLPEIGGEAAAGRLLERHLEHVHRGAPDETADEQVHGPVVELLRPRHLLQLSLAHDRDAVTHGHGLDLIVGDVDRRRSEAILERADLGPGLHAQLRIEIGQGLVHEEGGRLAHDRPPHRDPLALAAGERARLALQELLQAEGLRGLLDALVDLRSRRPPQPERKRDVLVDRQMRVERIALEDHGDVAVAGRDVVHDPIPDSQHALADVLQARDHPKCCCLPAPGWADENHELTVGNLEVQRRNGSSAVRIHLRHIGERHARHQFLLMSGHEQAERPAREGWFGLPWAYPDDARAKHREATGSGCPSAQGAAAIR